MMKQKKKQRKVVPENIKVPLSAAKVATEDSPMDEDISGSRKPISSAKPDILREDHPDLAK